ncbi:MAG: lipid A biosynthesis acyltransferase [Candidatus Thiodiazotropha taylori]|nr:lipid A biosynthesis acyltransferase [Candidatus Thiodiazotropha taylori]
MLERILFKLWYSLHRLPLSWLHALGRVLGRIYTLIPNRELRVTEINLAICYPEMVEGERRQLRNQTMQQIGATLMEMSAIWFRPLDDVLTMIHAVHGEKHLVRGEGQGLIILAPHIGCWEIVGVELQRRGRLTNLYRPPRKESFGDLIKQARERGGAELVPTDNRGVKRILQTLKTGGMTGILPDQQPKSDGGAEFAPFFGRPALTMMLTNKLARKTGAKVILACAERLAGGRGYDIHYLPAPDGIADADPQRAARALNQGVETLINMFPSQYQWSYKRFSKQPDGVPSPYKKQP